MRLQIFSNSFGWSLVYWFSISMTSLNPKLYYKYKKEFIILSLCISDVGCIPVLDCISQKNYRNYAHIFKRLNLNTYLAPTLSINIGSLNVLLVIRQRFLSPFYNCKCKHPSTKFTKISWKKTCYINELIFHN